MSGMISSCMFSSAPPIVKNSATAGMAMSPRPVKRLTIAPTRTRNVPRRSTTTQAAPQMRIVITTSMPAAKPRGTAITARNGPTALLQPDDTSPARPPDDPSRDHPPLVFAGREDPGERRCNRDGAKEED